MADPDSSSFAWAASLPSAAGAADTVQTWRDVHTLLSIRDRSASSVADLLGFTVYHHCVYDAFGQEQDAALARGLFNQLPAALAQQPFSRWPVAELDQLCALAWLYTRFASETAATDVVLPLLNTLDQILLHEGLSLLTYLDPESRRSFFRVVRYFRLRLPHTESQLRQLLTQYLALDSSAARPGTWQLGLAEGLAGELLGLMQLSRAGLLPAAGAQPSVREGLLHLLSLRREVDFLENRYSIFPDQVNDQADEASFSAELSWSRGDIGQALLLYEAHELLQDEELAKIAELVGLNTLLRTTIRTTGIVSSQFGRGAGGVACLYQRLYHASRHPAYREGYRFWLGQTEKWLRQELATDFYQHQQGDLLHGLVGVGLVLLSDLTEQDLGWHSILL